jgi:hypothetical protein
MLQAVNPPDGRMHFDKETAPWWKAKEKQWYKDLKDGPEKKTDFDGYFNVRRKLIESMLTTLDQGSKAPTSGQS